MPAAVLAVVSPTGNVCGSGHDSKPAAPVFLEDHSGTMPVRGEKFRLVGNYLPFLRKRYKAARMSPRPRDPEFYRCPRCSKALVDWCGEDTEKRSIYRCRNPLCSAIVSEAGLRDQEATRRRMD
jgi:hypothetical protein